MLFKLIIKFITYNKLRSFLVWLSIFISSLFFISIIGLGNAQKEIIIQNLNRLTADIIIIVPVVIDNPLLIQRTIRTGFVVNLFTNSDFKYISEVEGVIDVYKSSSSLVEVNTKKDQFSIQAFAIEKRGINILYEISNLEQGKEEIDTGEVLIGGGLAERYNLRLGDYIKINGRIFKISGIFKKVGQNLFNLDNGMFMLHEDLVRLLNLDDTKIYSMIVKFDRTYNETLIKERIYEILDRSRKINDLDKRNYSLLSASSVSSQIGALIDGVRLFFLFIAFISIIVSLINLTNNLYIFISEKYKQIATLKVIGANKSFIFSLILGMVALFIIAGIAPTIIIILFISNNIPFKLYDTDLALSFLLLILSGYISSYFPTKLAYSIEPGEALKYE